MPENTLFCSQCGTQNIPSARFCQKCGAGLGQLMPVAPAAAVAPAVAYAPPAVVPGPPYGGFWIRVLANLLDGVILSAVITPIFLIFLLPMIIKAANQANADQAPPPELFIAIFAMIPLIWIGSWLYESLLTSSSWQGTIGKRILRLKVTDQAGNRVSFGRATGRFFGKILSGMIMNVGYIMVAFTERKQGLHDIIAGTVVTRY